MPLYSYKCKDCDNEFELLRSMAESSSGATCAVCGSRACRLPSRAWVNIFKPIFYEHTSLEGNWFESKKELKEFSKKNEMIIPGAYD